MSTTTSGMHAQDCAKAHDHSKRCTCHLAANYAKPEAVNHPPHYGGADNTYEVIKVLHAWGLESNALLWNAVKYIARAGKKDPSTLVEDLEKARWYLDRAITNAKLLERVAP